MLGGSWFVGRAIAEVAVGRGLTVTVFHRGLSGPAPAGVEVVHGDREDAADLRRLAGYGPWDVMVGVSGSVPAVVGLSARMPGPAVEPGSASSLMKARLIAGPRPLT